MKKVLLGLILTIIHNLSYAGTGPMVTGNITHSTIPTSYYFLDIYGQDSPTSTPDFSMNIFFMPGIGFSNGGLPITITKLIIENQNPSCQDKNHIFTLPLPLACGVTVKGNVNININGALEIKQSSDHQLECPDLSVSNLSCNITDMTGFSQRR